MKKFHLFILLTIIGVGIFLRSYRFSELFYFTHDEETIVWRTMPLLRDHNLFLLGGVTPFHVHLGPWFYYLSAVSLFISSGNPLGWGILAALVSTCTMLMLFILTRKLYGLVPGLLAASYYATSYLMVAFDRHWWPLSLGPLLILLVIQFFHQAAPLGLTLALGFHTDPSNWALVLLSLFTRKKTLAIALTIIAISLLPLVAFDLKNSGKNILFARQYFTETKPHQGWNLDRFIWTALYIPRTLGRLVYSPQTELTEIHSYCQQYSQGRIESAPIVTTILVVVIIMSYFFLPPLYQRGDQGELLIKRYFLLIFVGLNIYGNFFSSDLFDHYLVTLFPLFFIMIASILVRLPRALSCVAIILFVVINFNSFLHISDRYGYADKLAAVDWTVDKLDNQPFSLDVLGSCFRYSGIRYLFTLQGQEPDLSYVDPNFFWLYKTPPKTEYPGKHVVFVMPNFSPAQRDTTESAEFQEQYQNLLGNIIARRQFGDIDVLIVDNRDQKFHINFSQQ